MTENKVVIQNIIGVEDYAKSKGVTIQTVYNWLKAGKVKKVQFMGKYFIDKSTYKEVV